MINSTIFVKITREDQRTNGAFVKHIVNFKNVTGITYTLYGCEVHLSFTMDDVEKTKLRLNQVQVFAEDFGASIIKTEDAKRV